MDLVLPLLVAFVGAGCGAYFAVVKSKNERLWIEKYELLNELVCDLDVVNLKFTVDYLSSMGVSVSTEYQMDDLYTKFVPVTTRISKNISRLQLLFRSYDIEEILAARVQLNSSFQDLHNRAPDDYLSDYLQSVADQADTLREKVIHLAQTKCL